MSFLKKIFNSNTRLICSEFLLLTFTALPALAGDNCSPKDRVPLPGCMEVKYIENGAMLTNYCDNVVTVKVDIADAKPDKMVEVGANGGQTPVTVEAGDRYNLKCCPKYNKCT